MSTGDLLPWPERPPIHHEPGPVEVGGYEYDSCPICHAYERARADAAIARLRKAVEALQLLAVEANDEDYISASFVSAKCDEALSLIGDIPE